MRVHRVKAYLSLWISRKRAGARKAICYIHVARHSISSASTQTYQSDHLCHTCDIDAEPLHRYGKGGYHPVHLGDLLQDERYKILHKLGWGGYSTVWAARDQKDQRNVAIKISVSRSEEKSREIETLRALAATRPRQPGSRHVMQMLDHFQIDGPNGTHSCLVLELLGPSISDLLDVHFGGERLPGKLAKSIAKQALIGLNYLHQQKIGHGDLHVRNLALCIPSMHTLKGEEVLRKMRDPQIGSVRRKDGKPLDPGIPHYIVEPASYPADFSFICHPIKIIDIGESFVSDSVPGTLHTPLAVRAPEVIFREKLDYRVDLWSMGCMLFELVVGQPPFDSMMTTPTILVRQMLETTGEELPVRWHESWRAMDSESSGNSSGQTLQDWLEEMYFDGERREDFTREDILQLGGLVRRMLRLEPSNRVSAQEILQDPWFEVD